MEHGAEDTLVETASGAVPAIRRALRVFELLANSKRGLTVSEISRKLGLPKSSAHRILTTLETEGCVVRNGESGRYYFGVKLFSFNRAALEGLELREEAKPLLAALMQRTGLTVHMAVLEHNQAVLIEKLEPIGQPTVGTWVGRAMDANSTAAGKALIAFLSPSELSARFKPRTFVRHNRKTIVSMARLKEELAQVRKLGYAVDNEEDELGVRCVGAPVFQGAKGVVAAISVVGTVDQVPEERIEPLGEMVRRTAAAISARVGDARSRLKKEVAGEVPAFPAD